MSIMDHRLINSNKIWQKYQKGEGKKNNTFSTWTQKSPLKDSEINVTAKNKQHIFLHDGVFLLQGASAHSSPTDVFQRDLFISGS